MLQRIVIWVVVVSLVLLSPFSWVRVRAQPDDPEPSVEEQEAEDGPPDDLALTYADGEEPLGPYLAPALANELGGIAATVTAMVPPFYLSKTTEIDPATGVRLPPSKKSEKKLVLSPHDLNGMREGLADQRLVQALTFLTERKFDHRGYLLPSAQRGAGHDRIKAILNKGFDDEEDMVNEDNPDEPYVVANALWQGAEIQEIDNVTCRLKIKSVVKTKYRDLPPAPIKAIWQSDQGLAQQAPGLSGATVREMLRAAGGGALTSIFDQTDFAALLKEFKGKNLGDWAMLIGGVALAQELGIELEGDNLWDVFENGGRAIIARALGLPKDGLKGSSFEEILGNIGRNTLEGSLGLPSGALAGNLSNGTISADSLFASMGQRIFEERVLGVRPWTLSQPYTDKDSFSSVVGKALVEEYIGLPQGSLGKRRVGESSEDVQTLAKAKEGIGIERFDAAFAQPTSVDTVFGLPQGTTRDLLNRPTDDGAYRQYFLKVAQSYLERFRTWRDYTYQKPDPDNEGEFIQVTENFRDRAEDLPAGSFDAMMAGQREPLRAIGVDALGKILGGTNDGDRQAFAQWLGQKNFDQSVTVKDGETQTEVKFDDLEPSVNAFFDLLGDDIPRIFARDEAAEVFRHHGQRTVLQGVKPLAERELARSRIGGKLTASFASLQRAKDALADIDVRLGRLDQAVTGAQNKAKVARLKAERAQVKGKVNRGRALQALSVMKAVLSELKESTLQNVKDEIAGIERDIGILASIVGELTGETIPPAAGQKGGDGWSVEKLQFDEKVPLLGLTKGEIFNALAGKNSFRDVAIKLGGLKWEKQFNLPRNSIVYFLQATKGVRGLPYSKDTLLESVGRAFVEEQNRSGADYTQEELRSLGEVALQRTVAAEIAERFGLDTQRYQLTTSDIVGLFHGQWQRVAVKVGAAQLNLALEWPPESEGILKIIDDPQSIAEPGSPSLLDILEEGFTYKLAVGAGLKHPFSLQGDIRANFGAVSVEDRLGLKPKTFRGTISDVLQLNGGVRFAAAFNINLPKRVQDEIERARQGIEREYGSSRAGAQELQRLSDEIVEEFLRAEVLKPGGGAAYWDEAQNHDAAKRVDALLGVDFNSTLGLLDGGVSVEEYTRRAGKGIASRLAIIADGEFHLSKALGLPEGTIGIIAGLLGKDSLTGDDRARLLGLIEQAAGFSMDGAINDLVGGDTQNGKMVWQPGTARQLLEHPDKMEELLIDQGIRILADQLGRNVSIFGEGFSIDTYTLLKIGFAYVTDRNGQVNGNQVSLYQQGINGLIRAGIFTLTGSEGASASVTLAQGNVVVSFTGAGIDVGDKYAILLAKGDMRALSLVGLAYVNYQINYYEKDGQIQLVPENLRITFDDLAKAIFGDPMAEDKMVGQALGDYRHDYTVYLAGGGVPKTTGQTDDDEQRIAYDARKDVRQGFQKRAVYKLLDSLAYRNGLVDIPQDFSLRLMEGTARQRMEALLDFAGNMLTRGDPRLNRQLFPDLYAFFFGDPNDPKSGFHNADKISSATFSALTNIFREATGWDGMPVEFVGGIFYSIANNWEVEKSIFRDGFNFKSFVEGKDKSFAIGVLNWAVDGIGNWATKHWGLPANGVRQIYDTYRAYLIARNAYFFSQILEGEGDDFLLEHIKNEVRLNEARFALVNVIVNVAFSRQLRKIEEKYGLPPGTMSQAVTIAVAAIMHANINVVGPAMALINGFFGDEFSSFEEKQSLPRGIITAGVNVGVTYVAAAKGWLGGASAGTAIAVAWAAFVFIALFSPYKVEYQCRRPPPSRAIGEPAYTDARRAYRPGWDNGKDLGLWKRWAQYEVNRLIGELVVGLPARYGEEALPSQIETLRSEDVAAWRVDVDNAYGPLEQRGDFYGVGYGGLPDRVHFGY